LETHILDASLLRKCFIAGAKNLRANKEHINDLNVFPVPDGDTGTNMTMTIMSAAEAVSAAGDADMQTVCKEITSGSLRGARGNSGVILSQLLRGFCKGLRDYNEADVHILAAAVKRASDTAYKAVMKPKEGTILTVARAMAECTEATVNEGVTDLTELVRRVVVCGNEALERTPELLPVLKEAGVVDSGGQGLMCVMEGVLSALDGSFTDFSLEEGSAAVSLHESIPGNEDGKRKHISTDDIKFGYCTEFMVNAEKPVEDERVAELRAFLESIGDSIVCVHDEEIVKIHVHTNHPGLAFEKGLELGPLTRMKVDNMREEHEEKLIKDASKIATMHAAKTASMHEQAAAAPAPAKQERKENGFVSICSGEGLKQIFTELGVDYVIEGGQTMNPSTDDILKAVDIVNAENVYILPNNKNIILASEQARAINKEVNIVVVPTVTIPQGISAMINYCETVSPEENLKLMKAGFEKVRSGQVTYAVRNTFVDGNKITEGDIMGIGDRGILAVGQILNETAVQMVGKMAGPETELITVYYGADVQKEDAEQLCEAIGEALPELEVDLQYGGQPVYYYIISAE